MNVFQRYKLLYDGYGNKESLIQQETVKFFMGFFDKKDLNEALFEFV
jgi:hypothetical protein